VMPPAPTPKVKAFAEVVPIEFRGPSLVNMSEWTESDAVSVTELRYELEKSRSSVPLFGGAMPPSQLAAWLRSPLVALDDQ